MIDLPDPELDRVFRECGLREYMHDKKRIKGCTGSINIESDDSSSKENKG